MDNKQLLQLFNIKDTRVKFTEDNFLETKYNINNEKYNLLKGTLAYKVKKCPHCKSENLYKHGFDKVKIQIPNIVDVKSYLILDKQRYICNDCNKTFTVKFKDCEKHCRKSHALANSTSYYLIDTKISQKDISKVLKVSNSTISKQLNKYKDNIIINKKTLPEVLCIDEISGVRSIQGKYHCVLFDGKNKKIKDVLITRRQDYLEKYLNTYTKEAKEKVNYFICDMYAPYINLAKKHFKNAEIIIDRFHVVALLKRLLDSVRVSVMNKYPKHSIEYRVLKKFRYLLLKRYELISYNYQKSYYYPQFNCEFDKLNYMLGLSEELGTAYYLLQNLYLSFDNKDLEEFNKIFDEEVELYKKYPSVYKTYRTLLRYRKYITNSIIYPYSNGILENSNEKISLLKRNAYGFRNFDNFRTRIFMIFNYFKKENVRSKKKKSRVG